MTHLVFQRLDHAERLQTTQQLLARAGGTAIVVSTGAARLADGPQPPNRAGHHVVRLLLDPASGPDSFNPLDVLTLLPNLDLGDALSILLEPLRPPETPGYFRSRSIRSSPRISL